MKKCLSRLLAVVSCLCVWADVGFAADYLTEYRPWYTSVAPGPGGLVGADPFAVQRPGYPWCMSTCMKIVLKDVSQKYQQQQQQVVPPAIDFAAVNALINPHPVNLDPNRYDIEETIIKNVLLRKRANGDFGAFDVASDQEKDVFRGLLGAFPGPIPDKRKFDLFNGLLGMVDAPVLESVWNGLTGHAKKMIRPESDQAVIDVVQEMTKTAVPNSGLIGTFSDIGGNYNVARQAIVNEVKAGKMVVVIFQDPLDKGRQHACVAYGVQEDMPGQQPQHPFDNLAIYNPWGSVIVSKRATPGPVLDIDPGGQQTRNWQLFQYITFNY